MERQLESTATRFVKKWAGLAKLANPSLLYLPKRSGGLGLPSLSSLYKRLQVSRQCQLLTSPDPCVRSIAERALKAEVEAKRQKFRPAMVVREEMLKDPSRNRKVLAAAAKANVANEEEHADPLECSPCARSP